MFNSIRLDPHVTRTSLCITVAVSGKEKDQAAGKIVATQAEGVSRNFSLVDAFKKASVILGINEDDYCRPR